MHLEIIQNKGISEQVTPGVIEKLYNLASTEGQLDLTSNLLGKVELDATYEDYVNYLLNKYPNLIINATQYYFKFKDNVFGNICSRLYGDGTGTTTSLLASVTDITANNNALKTAIESASNLEYIDLRGFSGIPSNVTLGRTPELRFEKISTLKGIYLKNVLGKVSLNVCADSGTIRTGDSKKTIEKLIIDGIYMSHTNSTTGIPNFLDGWTLNPENPNNFETIAVRRIAPNRAYSDTAYYELGDYFTRSIRITNLYLGETNPERVRFKGRYGDNINNIVNFYVPIGCASAYINSSTWGGHSGGFLEYDFDNDPNGIFT